MLFLGFLNNSPKRLFGSSKLKKACLVVLVLRGVDVAEKTNARKTFLPDKSHSDTFPCLKPVAQSSCSPRSPSEISLPGPLALSTALQSELILLTELEGGNVSHQGPITQRNKINAHIFFSFSRGISKGPTLPVLQYMCVSTSNKVYIHHCMEIEMKINPKWNPNENKSLPLFFFSNFAADSCFWEEGDVAKQGWGRRGLGFKARETDPGPGVVDQLRSSGSLQNLSCLSAKQRWSYRHLGC